MGKFDILIISMIYLVFFSNCNNIVKNGNKEPKKPLDRAIEDTIRWSEKESPYILEDSVVVDSLELLNIESGVTVEFGKDVPFIIKGLVKAKGTKKDSIRFTTKYDDWRRWRGVRFDSCSKKTNFKNCIFEKYSSLEYAIYLDSSSPTFDNCSFEKITPVVETGGGFINSNYIEIVKNNKPNEIDMSLVLSMDNVGDGEFNTFSKSCRNVDGINFSRNKPN